MTTISGIKIKKGKKMNHWQSLVEEWILAHERFARFSPNDAAYWYSERTNVGILAGAAWRCGMVALEEFQTTKDNLETAKRADRRTWNGRCDLWLARDNQNEVIEAKYRPISIRSKKLSELAMSSLNEAVRDAAHSVWDKKTQATGLVFLPIFSSVRLAQDSPSLEEKLDTIVDGLSQLDVTLVAWCFPVRTRDLVSPNEKNYWPGLVMLGRSTEKT